MKPESAAFLQKAREFLAKAQSMLDHGWPDEAGRAAYLAGFHAAQALIFERSGRVLKTHSGVQTEFARLAKNETAFATELRRFLGRSYNLKQVADYETGSGAVVSSSQAEAALATATLLVATVTRLIH
jgi:uncharacterized protein (UPF0332 family)